MPHTASWRSRFDLMEVTITRLSDVLRHTSSVLELLASEEATSQLGSLEAVLFRPFPHIARHSFEPPHFLTTSPLLSSL